MTPRGFTGRHMLFSMLAFFGTIIMVNFTMAWFASSTFGGTVVDNSYVASQKYNGWLAAGRAQRALGWTVAVDLDAGRHVRLATQIPEGAVLTGTATHPLGRVPEQRLAFVPLGNGVWRSAAPLPAGRFHVRVEVRAAGKDGAFTGDVPA
jgi:nitrogen fixation protein FixH